MPTPQNPVMGEDNLVKIHDGGDPGTFLEVEYQDEATYSTGIEQKMRRTKNGTLPYRSKDGATLKFKVIKTRPLSAGQNRLWAVAESGELVQLEYEDGKTGGHKRAGYVQISMGDESSKEGDPTEVEFTAAFVDDPTQTVTP